MGGWWQVLDILYVRRPIIGVGILRAGDHKFVFRKQAGRFYHQPLEQRLPVLAVSAEITERPLRRHIGRLVKLDIGSAIERTCARTAVDALYQLQGRAAGKGKIQLETWNQRRADVFGAVARELAERDRRVDVIKDGDAARGARNPVAQSDAVGNERAE